MYVVVMCVLVIVAPPIVVGAWSMAFLLGQHVELLLVWYSVFSARPLDYERWSSVSSPLPVLGEGSSCLSKTVAN